VFFNKNFQFKIVITTGSSFLEFILFFILLIFLTSVQYIFNYISVILEPEFNKFIPMQFSHDTSFLVLCTYNCFLPALLEFFSIPYVIQESKEPACTLNQLLNWLSPFLKFYHFLSL